MSALFFLLAWLGSAWAGDGVILLQGTLSAGDAALTTGQYVDRYGFDCLAGDYMVVRVMSTDFDTYLAVDAAGVDLLLENDDASDGGGSLLTRSLPQAGPCVVSVSSKRPRETGIYTLMALGLGRSGPPQSGKAVQRTGTLVKGDAQLPSGEFFDEWSFQGMAGARVTLRLSSDAFHPYVSLKGPGFPGVASDAGGPGGGAFLDQVLANEGTYIVTATSVAPGESGAYRLDTSGFGPADDVPAERAVSPQETARFLDDVTHHAVIENVTQLGYIYAGNSPATLPAVEGFGTRPTSEKMVITVRVPAGSRLDGIDVDGLPPSSATPLSLGPELMYSFVFPRESFPQFAHFTLRGSGPVILYRFDK